jgi:hypothetical protein
VDEFVLLTIAATWPVGNGQTHIYVAPLTRLGVSGGDSPCLRGPCTMRYSPTAAEIVDARRPRAAEETL